MPEIVVFRPREALSAAENMREFVRVCRETLTVFGDVEWEADTWDVSAHVRTRSGYAGTRSIIRFSDTDGVSFPQPFGDFARAYLRYTFGFRQVSQRLIAHAADGPRQRGPNQRERLVGEDGPEPQLPTRTRIAMGADECLLRGTDGRNVHGAPPSG